MTVSRDPPAAGDPLDRHRRHTEAALSSKDAAKIKDLYKTLGDDFWDRLRVEPAYDVPVLSVPETLGQVTAALQGVTGLLLDAGCGPNPAVAMALARTPGRTIVILDIGWGTVRTARLLAESGGLDLLAVAGDVERLPFRHGVFDGLACDDTIEHLPDDRAGVAELARVLQPSGQGVLATPNRHSAVVLRARLSDCLHGVRHDRSAYFVASSHLREYTWGEFERLVSSCFLLERRHPVGWSAGRKKRLLSRLMWLPGLSRLSQIIVLECRPRSARHPTRERTFGRPPRPR